MNNHINKEYTTAGERGVISRLIKNALDRGYVVSVHDCPEGCGDWVVKSSSSRKEIEEALASTEGDILRFRPAVVAGEVVGKPVIGSVVLIYGNDPDGSEVIADYTSNPEIESLVTAAE